MNLQEVYNFFFDFNIKSSFAAFLRIAICSTCFIYMITIIKNLWNFSKPKGFFPYKEYANLDEELSLYNFKFFGNTNFGHIILFLFTYIFCITSILGFFTNFSLILFFLTFFSIESRAYPVIRSGGSAFVKIALFSLSVIDCGSRYSLDNILGIASNLETINGWSIRLMQIFICSMYFFSSLYKLCDKFWVNGDIIINLINNKLYTRNMFLHIFNKKYISKIIAHSIIFYQFFSPILFSIDEFRLFAIFFGIFIHLNISILMKIGLFGPAPIFFLLTFSNNYFK